MTRRLLLAALLAAACSPAAADESAAWAALRKDGAVALVRHGEAPGVGDPPNWKLDDCSTQRGLNEAGRGQARALGARLRAERIPVARLLASPWCRTLETATLLGVGTPQPDPTFSNAFVLSERRAELSAGARAVIAKWRGPGVLLVVTHGANIAALTGRHPATAELVVVAAADGTVREIAAIQTPPVR